MPPHPSCNIAGHNAKDEPREMVNIYTVLIPRLRRLPANRKRLRQSLYLSRAETLSLLGVPGVKRADDITGGACAAEIYWHLLRRFSRYPGRPLHGTHAVELVG